MDSSSTPAAKVNPGHFRKGADTRRHVHTATCGHKLYKFTTADCSNGFWSAIAVMGIGVGAKLHASGRWPNFRRA